MKKKSAMIAGLFALAQMAHAQTAPTPAQLAERLVQRYTVVLGLSSTVEEQAVALYTTEETTEQAIQTSQRAADKALVTAIEAANTANINTVAALIGTLRGQSVLAKATADAAFYALLTTEQQTKFQEMLQHSSDGPGGSRPGGPPRL